MSSRDTRPLSLGYAPVLPLGVALIRVVGWFILGGPVDAELAIATGVALACVALLVREYRIAARRSRQARDRSSRTLH